MTIKAPYPSDLAAKGWHLDLDYERIQQSDTWALATAEQRPWLLMVWLTSWHQVPVASLPSNRKLIAARIGMPLAQFEQWADVLLAGWQEADDGRLYHSTLTEIVLKMVDKRLKEKARVAKYRAANSEENVTRDTCVSNGDVTRYTPVTTPLVTHEYTRSTTPSPSPSPTDKEKEKTSKKEIGAEAPAPDKPSLPKFDPLDVELPECVSSGAWSEWIAYRRQERMSVKPACINAQLQNLQQWHTEGQDPNAIIRRAIASGWRGLFPDKAAQARASPFSGSATADGSDDRRARIARLAAQVGVSAGAVNA